MIGLDRSSIWVLVDAHIEEGVLKRQEDFRHNKRSYIIAPIIF